MLKVRNINMRRWVTGMSAGVCLASISVLALPVEQAQAAVLTLSNGITGSYNEEHISDATGFAVSNSDLLEGISPDATLSYLGPAPGSETTNLSPSVLTDGDFGGYLDYPTPRPYIFTTSSNPDDSTDYTKLYYILPSTPGGYDIVSIDTYSSMTTGSGRNLQNYIVSYATVANPVDSDFAVFAEVTAPYNPGSQHMQLLFDNLTSVTALKFEFPDQIANFVGYREIDVHGAAIPEPASLSLLTLGALGLMARRRKQI